MVVGGYELMMRREMGLLDDAGGNGKRSRKNT